MCAIAEQLKPATNVQEILRTHSDGVCGAVTLMLLNARVISESDRMVNARLNNARMELESFFHKLQIT